MRKIYVSSLLILLFLLKPLCSSATHIMGGGLYYEYLGLNTTTGKYEYRVSAKLYRYCDPGSAFLKNKLLVGVYNEDPANPNAAFKTKYGQFNIPRLSLTYIQPPKPGDSCVFIPNICVQEGYYSGIISLDASIGGYNLIADDCCRNANIINIKNPNNTGFAFYAFVPPTSIINSSPAFALPPIPFLCTSDTADLLNSAIDPDGDLLEYNLVAPINSITPTPPDPTPALYPWPIKKVKYAVGYNVAQPLGISGSATIDNTTGLSSFYTPFTGFYVVEVEIREYRAGQLIGITRRGLQLIFIPCPANEAPVVTANTTNFTINEGDTLCFNFTAGDANNDSLFLSYGGDVFDSTIVNPTATLTYLPDTGNITANFCWNTNCTTGRTTPYQFFVVADDNGCPAKSDITTFTIEVIPFTGPSKINGKDSICFEDLTNHNYFVVGSAGSSFNWAVTNGTINSGNGTDQIMVDFYPTGPHSVSVVETNERGCAGDTVVKNIFIEDIQVFAGNDTTVCSAAIVQLGTLPTINYQYSWSPIAGLNSATIADPVLTTANTGSTSISTTYVVTVTNDAGCTKSDSVMVTVNPLPVLIAGNDSAICSGESIVLGSPEINGYQYLWTPATFLVAATDAQPVLTPLNSSGNNDTLTYFLNVNLSGCAAADSVQVIVRPAALADSGSDINLCSGDTIQIGTAGVSGVNYSWAPATGLSSSTIANPFLIVPDTGSTLANYSYYLTAEFDGCFSYDTITISVNATPDLLASATPDSGCIGASVFLTAIGAIYYEWTVLNNPGVIISTADTLTVFPLVTTTYIVRGSTSLNCNGADTIIINVSSLPLVTITNTTDSICGGDSITLVASGADTYQWENISQPGVIISSNDSITPIINTNETYVVTGLSVAGCSNADTITIFYKPLPVATAGNDLLGCAFDTIYLGTQPVTGQTYSWSPTNGLSDPFISNPYLVISDTTPTVYTYIVTVTNDGCSNTDTVDIAISPAPVLNVLPVNPVVCIGSDVNLTAFGASSYQWYDLLNPGTILSNLSVLVAQPTINVTYVVHGFDATGCSNFDTVEVTISQLPVLSTSVSSVVICAGDSVTISVNGASTYQWETAANPGVIIFTDSVLTQSLTTATTFIIEGQNDYGCVSIATVTIDVTPLPIVFAGNDINICSGDTVQLGTTSQPGYTYSWSPPNGISDTAISNPTVIIPDTNVTITLTYTLSATANGCSQTDSVSITTNTNPVVQILSPDTICDGSALTLFATGATNYQWEDSANPGVIISTTDSVVFNGNTPITYIVKGTTSSNCFSTDTFTVYIAPNPIVNATAPNDSICKGDTISLVASGAQDYTWENIGAPGVIIGTGSTLNIFLNTTSTFIVTGYTAHGCTDKDTITITIIFAPAAPVLIGKSLICSGANVYPYVAVTALTGLTYTWAVVNGTILNGQGTDSINVSWNTAGPYQISVITSNALGCNSLPASIIVLEGAVTQLPMPTGTVAVCQNTIQSYTAPADTNFNYNWQITGGTIQSGNGTDTVTVNWGSAGLGLLWYSITTTQPDTLCYTNSDTLSVAIATNPVTSAITLPTAVCVSDSVTANVITTSGSTYTWTVSNGTILSGNGTSQIAILFNSSGTQTVTVVETNSNNCDGNQVTNTVLVHALPIVDAGNSASICSGLTTQLNASGGTTYLWTPAIGLSSSTIANPIANPVATTNYTVTATNANGCSANDTVTVEITANVSASASSSAAAICEGGQSQLQAAGGTDYLWTPATGLSNTAIANPIANPIVTTSYTVTVSSVGLCADTAVIEVVVNAAPLITITGSNVICEGSSTQLSATGASSYQWLPVTGLSNAAIGNPVASPLLNTIYTVSGTNIFGCTNSSTITVDVNANPTAAFDTNLVSLNCEGTVYDFVNTSANATSYDWSFGDGTASNSSDPQHAYNFGSVYTTMLTAIAGPCADSISIQINPGNLSTYFDSIPNIFTPNNDGINDCFEVSSIGDFASCTTIEIYNQWGNSLFKSSSTQPCWNGESQKNNKQVPQGTYMYSIIVNGSKFNGTVLLIR